MTPSNILDNLLAAGFDRNRIIHNDGELEFLSVKFELEPGIYTRASNGWFDLFVPTRTSTYSDLSGQREQTIYRYRQGKIAWSIPEFEWMIQTEDKIAGVSFMFPEQTLQKAYETLNFGETWDKATIRGGWAEWSPELAYLALHLYDMAHSRRPENGHLFDQTALTLIGLLLDRFSSPRTENIHSDAVRRSIIYINEMLTRPLSVASIAEAANSSEANLNRLFRSEMGVSVWQFVLQTRLQKIKSELDDNRGTFDHLAKLYGYKSVSAAALQFKKLFSYSPLQ